MSQFFNSRLWTGKEMRRLDQKSGLETLLVTVNWKDFTDGEIVADFAKWLQSDAGRPEGVGQRDAKGKNKEITWQASLERLAILHLLHHYSFPEIEPLLPDSWFDMEKFQPSSEARRERRAVRRTLLELYPFLPIETTPRSWQLAGPSRT